MSSSFTEVFNKIKLPSDTKNALGSAFITDIKLSRTERKLNINMELNEVVEEKYFDSLCVALKNEFPFMDNICVDYRLTGRGGDLRSGVMSVWGNVMHRIEKISYFCYQALGDAMLDISENTLTIKVRGGAFMFTRRGIDKKIQKMLEGLLSTSVWVKFDEIKSEKGQNDFLEKKNLLLSEAAAQMREAAAARPMPSSSAPAYTPASQGSGEQSKKFKGKQKQLKVVKELDGVITKLSEELEDDEEILISGEIFQTETREIKNGKLLVMFDLTDGTNSIGAKIFTTPEKYKEEFEQLIQTGSAVSMCGKVRLDEFSKQLCMFPTEICGIKKEQLEKTDDAPVKRVELHLHTNMSQMDAINPASDYIKRAVKWGHKAVAITDHGVVQAFPEAMEASKKLDLKVIYGVEAYLVDDLEAIVRFSKEQGFDDEFIVFDIETTGLTKETDYIIEIGAVKIINGEIIDRYGAFIDPGIRLPEKIIELTNITDDMLKGKPSIESVLPDFLAFAGNGTLVAHNAAFDVGFITEHASRLGISVENTWLDTLGLSRVLFPNLGRHKLNNICDHLGITLNNHHRAVDDAAATAEIFLKCVPMLKEKGVQNISGINSLAETSEDKSKLKQYHAVILAKDYKGLRNLYELISKAHINYFYKRPRIPKSEYVKHKEGLLIGTACEAGEFFKAVREKAPEEEIKHIADFYDYLEIQPTGNNMYLIREGYVTNVKELEEINKRIIGYGDKFNKPVVATCDVHFIDPEGEIYRRIIQSGDGYKDADLQPPLYFRTTEEMLKEFNYLGEDKAYEVVVENTNLIADMIEKIKPIPSETYPPKIDGAEEELKRITMEQAWKLYGKNLPAVVTDRLERELNSIIKNGFSVMYIIAQKLVWKSVADGYLVGSRGSVGSSFVATMAGITEVNPLQPHYLCPVCNYSDFDSELVKSYTGASGCDMPDMSCPNCGTKLLKEGHDIPFETFLGFDGDKEPDIDLNFSGEYQAKAHAYTEELFGSGYVFKAGTIGTIADKTAYGYVKKYFEEKGVAVRDAEINRLKLGCTGIKRTTGQHPGGLMIVPDDKSIYEFCPIQHPANDSSSNVITTHFDYHSISGRLLKLDILGHDVPTIIRMLHDNSGVDPREVDLGDKEVMSLFKSPRALGVTEEEIGCNTGTLGLPEFGTSFVRQMLADTKPDTFAELVRICGLSHGTNVWLGNAQELVKSNTATLKEIIPARDDIMLYLINKGVEKKAAFKIMENVRKGFGLKDSDLEILRESNVPEWYIESCQKIKYLFPKGHAVAYVMMTVRIGYFKIHHPLSFYAASFSVKAEDFDYMLMCRGREVVRQEMARINSLGKEATAKEKNLYTILELALEMYSRGLKFVPVDLYKSEANKFKVTPEGLLPPLCSVQGLGLSVANNIVEARKDGEFITQENFKERTKANKNVIELLKTNDVFNGIPETSQLSLFN